MRVVAVVALVAVALPAQAAASELIARKATNVRLEVSRNGKQALVSYRARGRTWYVLASGAINAKPPTPGGHQVSFRLRRSTSRPRFSGGCRRSHPAIPVLVRACAAGSSSWAVQSWLPLLPNFGVKPQGVRAQPELRLSHWTGETAVLTLKTDWSFRGKWEHVYGSVTYRGTPVHGFATSSAGVPTDSFGRIVYLDTFDSAYGQGWFRENGFVTHNPFGNFCYDLSPHRDGLTGKGAAYRGMVEGPGVTPDVGAYVTSPGPFDVQRDMAANAEQAQMAPGDKKCAPS
jgi:hypothetical protein